MHASFASVGFLSLLSCHSLFVCAAPSLGSAYELKEAIFPPRGWRIHGTPSPDHIIELRIGLPQSNLPLLKKHLFEISDPLHERYGQHLSKEEVETLIAPQTDSIDSVHSWLSSFGYGEDTVSRSPAQDWVMLKVPVHAAEKMLDTTYHVWKNEEDDDYVVRCTSYSLPSHLHSHIDVIQPTTMFGRFKQQRSTIFDLVDLKDPLDELNEAWGTIVDPVSGMTVNASCNASVTLTCLQQLYNFKDYTPSAKSDPKNSIGVTGFLEQFANHDDLQAFYLDQRLDALGSSFEFVSVNGGINSQNISQAGDEASLDIQFAFGLAYPIPGVFYSTAGRPPFNADNRTQKNTNEPYAEWLDYVLSHENPPFVISTSYGDDEQTVPESYARRVCDGFMQLGLRGVSVIFSSGDWGVGDGNNDPDAHKCQTNDGRNVTRFIPTFPASCPYVTAVGSTQNIPEVATVRFASGGGFSDYFPQPSYQEDYVEKFLDSLPEGHYDGLYNRNGRAFPDVAALGEHYRIWVKGFPKHVGGTSASTPTFAAIISLLNDARFKLKKEPLGFLNPLLYSKVAETFNDITIGNNRGCGTDGFEARAGWDPVTGLGTPNFEKLKDILANSDSE